MAKTDSVVAKLRIARRDRSSAGPLPDTDYTEHTDDTDTASALGCYEIDPCLKKPINGWWSQPVRATDSRSHWRRHLRHLRHVQRQHLRSELRVDRTDVLSGELAGRALGAASQLRARPTDWE